MDLTYASVLAVCVPPSIYVAATEAPTGHVITLGDMLSYSYQIACGLQHLTDKKVRCHIFPIARSERSIFQILHRDIAIRNMLLTKEGVVKVADFGLARRNNFTVDQSERVPVQWMALEALHGDFGPESEM